MFYSQFILAKKGPLGTIWIAAHLERKLRKNQVADTDIGVSVDSILSPDVPIALRLSSHLLLGVVRVYSRKVNYLFDDCSEALLKVKQAFRSAAVDLPPEESKAPYHSITLPETFDLDDFELPDNDIFQGNFVDHHISAREQITLQDNMEGIGYITSKFGLDERFGDGDASGLDLDENLFLDKIGTTGQTIERSDPQPSVGKITTLKQDEQHKIMAIDSGIRIDGVDDCADPMDYAQAPSTPGLVEELNLFNVQEVSDHLEAECPLVESTMTENVKNNTYGDKQDVDWCSHDKAYSDAVAVVLTEEHEYRSDGLDINLSKPLGESPIETNMEHDSVHASSSRSKCTSYILGQVKALNPPLELTDKVNESSAAPCTNDLENGDANKNKSSYLVIDEPNDDHQGIYEIVLDKKACEIVSVNDQGSLGLEVPNFVELASNGEKSSPDYSDLASKSQDGYFLRNPDTLDSHEPTDSRLLNLDVRENVASSETPFLRPCNTNVEKPDVTSGCVMSTYADVQSDVAALATSGGEETVMLGKACCVTKEILKENHVEEHASEEETHAASSEPKSEVHNANSTEAELPAPEKLLSVPEGHMDLHQGMLVKGSPGAFLGLDESDAGSKIVSGKKRSFTESTLTEQSLNSVESSRLVRFKRTVESVPDDDDLLSSILVGRSSVLKVKPTPRLSEVTSMKRSRAAPRMGTLKRKVLMDDTMVLHGDTIRQQLANTEDIRRVRKKAPCTRPEISLIRKRYLEDEIFLEPIFTGMSLELVFLHSQTCDISGITVCKNDLNDASLETAAELSLTSENNKNIVRLETMAEPILASHDIKNDRSLAAAEPHISSQNAENVKISQLSNNIIKEIDETNEEINISIEQTKPTSDVEADPSQQELLLDVTGVQTSEKLDNAVNCSDVTGLETLHSIGDASVGMVQQDSITETVDTNISDVKTDVPSIELESGVMDVDNGQAVSRDELTVQDSDFIAGAEFEPEARDNVTPEVVRDGSTVELLSNAKQGETEHNGHSENSSVISGGHIVASQYSVEVGLQEDGFMNNGENPVQTEVHERYMMDAEISGFDVHDQEELKYPAAGNDTEFLNVDDDELDEIDDDHIADDEEARFTENTGWSSRTRAVSKYLQTLFVNEAGLGMKSLSMDNLLVGKSRKEASRMFFEALVLKTRDYIHVEQRNPFNDITIKPRTKLIKSDF